MKVILKEDSSEDADASEALSSWLGKALIKCFVDDSERARAKALQIFHDQVSGHTDVLLPMLPYVMPILEERLVKEEGCDRREPCEEVRQQLINVRPSHPFLAAIPYRSLENQAIEATLFSGDGTSEACHAT